MGNQIYKKFREWLRLQQSREEYYWLVCVFDSASASLHVHGTGKYREQCCAEIKAELDSLFADSVREAVTQIVGNGLWLFSPRSEPA